MLMRFMKYAGVKCRSSYSCVFLGNIFLKCSLNFITVGGDFSDRLDEVSEHYLSKGVCEGEECGHLKVQVG